MPGVLFDGITIVITPLIALMEDQVSQLSKRNIKAVAIHSGMNHRKIERELDNCIFGKTKFLYISPERVNTELFKQRVQDFKVSQIAIDEAHCISQWGHDFRPAYRELSILREFFPKAITVAFTATATNEIVRDIQEVLLLDKAEVFRSSFVKSNLHYTVIYSKNKLYELRYLMHKLPGVGIIYSRSRKGTESLANYLLQLGFHADYYHAGLSYDQRQKKQQQWISDPTMIMVCTNAFGMGIDKPDVRYVIHFDLPGSLEEYYQEAGRAGRDLKKAFAVLLYNELDVENAKSILELSLISYDEAKHAYDQLGKYLKIPEGGGQAYREHPFDIVSFSEYLQWNVNKTKSALKTLEKNALIVTSENTYQTNKIKVLETRRQLQNDPNLGKYSILITELFRLYEYLTEYPVTINESKLAKRIGTSKKDVQVGLRYLDQKKYISYMESSEFPILQFTDIRLPLRNVVIDKELLEYTNQLKRGQLDAMLQYLTLDTCRENYILHYFDEQKSIPCGRCDICLGSQDSDFTIGEATSLYDKIKNMEKEAIPMSTIIYQYSFLKRKKIIALLSYLENERKITVDKNEIRLADLHK